MFGTPSALSGHIKHIRLLDGALNSVQEIESYPGTATTQSIITRTVEFAAPETSRYDAMRDLFISGKTVLESSRSTGPGENPHRAFAVRRGRMDQAHV